MSIKHLTIPVTTDAGGAATVYSAPCDGTLVAVRALIGTLAAGAVDIAITDEASGMALLTITNLAADTDYFPRGPATSPAGAAITNSFVELPVSGRAKVVVAQGTAAKTGTVHLWVREAD